MTHLKVRLNYSSMVWQRKGWDVQDFDLVWQKAEQLFGEKNKAAVWLSTPKQLFGGLTAIDYMKDQEAVERVLGGADSDRSWIRLNAPPMVSLYGCAPPK